MSTLQLWWGCHVCVAVELGRVHVGSLLCAGLRRWRHLRAEGRPDEQHACDDVMQADRHVWRAQRLHFPLVSLTLPLLVARVCCLPAHLCNCCQLVHCACTACGRKLILTLSMKTSGGYFFATTCGRLGKCCVFIYVFDMRRFSPPGQLSVGMTCKLHVTFKPMVSRNCWILY